MTSLREQIITAIVALLDAPGKPAGTVVHRMRGRPIESDEKALHVYNGKEVAAQMGGSGGPLTSRRHIVRIEARAAGDPIDAALDPLLVWAVSQLISDPTLGGLATDVKEHEVVWDFHDGEKTLGVAYMDVVVEYVTLRADSTRRR